jgi:hypothetical protein
MELELQNDPKKLKRGRRLFVISLLVVSLLSIAWMNTKYDSLSRYPYTDQKSRQLIKKYLNKSEIEYIIEYSIAPNMFIAYIQEDGFNIYHAAEYKALSAYEWQASPASIVKMVEETRNQIDVDTLAAYLQSYTYEELHQFLTEGDVYSGSGTLLQNAASPEAYLNDTIGVGMRTPQGLQELNAAVPAANGAKIIVSETIQHPLQDLCAEIQQDAGSTIACDGLSVEQGYISYEAQKQRYESAQAQYGHGGRQVRILSGPQRPPARPGGGLQRGRRAGQHDFAKTSQYRWLQENAYMFGFVEDYTRPEDAGAHGQERAAVSFPLCRHGSGAAAAQQRPAPFPQWAAQQ